MTSANGYDYDTEEMLEGDGMGDFGEPESTLPYLGGDAFNLSRPDEGRRDDRTWSEVLRRQQDLNMDYLWDFIRDNKPDSHEGRNVMMNVASAAIFTLSSQALQLKRQMEDLEDRERKIKGELDKDEQKKASDLFDGWAKGNAMQEYLVCLKYRYGFQELERREPPYEEDEKGVPIPVTTGPRWDWYNADWKMREAIFELTARAHELYMVWQDMARLRRNANENRAKRLPDMDVSEWLKKVRSGKATNLEKMMGGTYLIQELVTFGLAHQGKDNPHWQHIERLYRGITETASRRGGIWRRKQSMSDGGPPSGGEDA